MSEERDENIFNDLVPTAKKTLHKYMVGGDSKLAVNVASDVLDRAGKTKKTESRAATQVFISNSQVAILQQTADEVEAKIDEDNLYVPKPEELTNGKAK